MGLSGLAGGFSAKTNGGNLPPFVFVKSNVVREANIIMHDEVGMVAIIR